MFESVMWKYMKEEKDLLLKTFNTKLEILDIYRHRIQNIKVTILPPKKEDNE